MKPKDYPALWHASNIAAAEAQLRFFGLVRLHLGLLGLIGILAAWNPTALDTEHVVSAAVAFAMFAALILGLVLRLARPDDAWFGARAFAENTKSAAWRFMMNAGPGPEASNVTEADFLDELKQIRARFPAVEKRLADYGTGEELTATMRTIRARDMQDRLAFYLKHRLEDQLTWYRENAKRNGEAEQVWFVLTLVMEALGVGAAVVRMLFVGAYNPTGAVAALAACLLAWSHTKRFSDLASTYGVACRDLNDLKARVSHVKDDRAFDAFVREVEGAISREHRLWVEQRSAT